AGPCWRRPPPVSTPGPQGRPVPCSRATAGTSPTPPGAPAATATTPYSARCCGSGPRSTRRQRADASGGNREEVRLGRGPVAAGRRCLVERTQRLRRELLAGERRHGEAAAGEEGMQRLGRHPVGRRVDGGG